jgi:hypothetical protein
MPWLMMPHGGWKKNDGEGLADAVATGAIDQLIEQFNELHDGSEHMEIEEVAIVTEEQDKLDLRRGN